MGIFSCTHLTISLLVTLNPPMYGHPVRPTLRRNKGHWIIAQTAPLSRLAAASWMYAEFIGFPFALPHFPSCFCNGFPLGIGQLLSRIINQNLASPLAGRRKEPIWGNIRRDVRTERQTSQAAEQMPLLLFGRKRTQCARSSFLRPFFQGCGKINM